MKSLLSAFPIMLFLFAQLNAQAQWTTGTNINNTNTGSVGVGAAPNTSFKFHVTGAGSTTLAGSIALFSGAIPATAANFYGIAVDKNGANSLLLGINRNSVTGSSYTQIPSNNPFISSYIGGLSIGRGGNNGMPNSSDITIAANGNAGIGYYNPQVLLAVRGTVYCTRLKVTPTSNSTDWPDYVFADDYKLISLDSVENYVKANKHLPDVVSAQEVVDNGLDVADNQKAMLQKIEELTLYIIQQQKELKALADKVTLLGNAEKTVKK